MKPVYYILIIFLVIGGGFFLFRPSSQSVNPPTPTSKPIIAVTEAPTPTAIPTVVQLPTATETPTKAPNPTEVPTKIPTPTVTKAVENKVQIIKAIYNQFGFTPGELTVKANQPVRLEVYSGVDGRGCMGSITIPQLTEDIQVFKKGETNVFEFTPTSPGQYSITCAMGIPHGFLIVQ